MFGEIVEGQVYLSEVGRIVREVWLYSLTKHTSMKCDYFVIMPNHFHAIVDVKSDNPIENRRKNVSDLVGLFKNLTTRKIHKSVGLQDKVIWQRSFYDHVIRDERDLENIIEYIENNPLSWEQDKENV